MTAPTQADTHELKRVLRLGDLVLFNLVAVLGLRWLATSAKAGPSALVLWLLAALFFFVPQGLAVIELSSRFPDEGGIYAVDQARVRREARLPVRLVLLDQQRPVLSQPADLDRGDRDVRDRQGRQRARRRLDVRAAGDAGRLWLAAGLNIVGRRDGQVAAERRRGRDVPARVSCSSLARRSSRW